MALQAMYQINDNLQAKGRCYHKEFLTSRISTPALLGWE